MSDMRIYMNPIEGAVVLTFGAAVTWVKWTPEQARQVADELKRLADMAEKPPTPGEPK
jgi:hypothetical protein